LGQRRTRRDRKGVSSGTGEQPKKKKKRTNDKGTNKTTDANPPMGNGKKNHEKPETSGQGHRPVSRRQGCERPSNQKKREKKKIGKG